MMTLSVGSSGHVAYGVACQGVDRICSDNVRNAWVHEKESGSPLSFSFQPSKIIAVALE